MPDWIKSTIKESGKYPKTSFVGTLQAIYPTVTDKDIPVLQLEFADGQTYNLPTKNRDGKYGVHGDGMVDGFMAIGLFIQSLERLDAKTGQPASDPAAQKIRTLWAFDENGDPAGFKTEPDIVGCQLHNTAVPRQIGDESQTSKYPDWTISQVDGLNKPGTSPSTNPSPSPAPIPSPAQDNHDATAIMDVVLDAMTEPRTISQLFVGFQKKYKVSQLRDGLNRLKVQGIVTERDGVYTVV